MRKPAKMLPKARRLIELVRGELFSLMEIMGGNRGWLSKAKKIIRVL